MTVFAQKVVDRAGSARAAAIAKDAKEREAQGYWPYIMNMVWGMPRPEFVVYIPLDQVSADAATEAHAIADAQLIAAAEDSDAAAAEDSDTAAEDEDSKNTAAVATSSSNQDILVGELSFGSEDGSAPRIITTDYDIIAATNEYDEVIRGISQALAQNIGDDDVVNTAAADGDASSEY